MLLHHNLTKLSKKEKGTQTRHWRQSIRTLLKAMMWKLLRNGIERMGFPGCLDVILNWTELNWTKHCSFLHPTHISGATLRHAAFLQELFHVALVGVGVHDHGGPLLVWTRPQQGIDVGMRHPLQHQGLRQEQWHLIGACLVWKQKQRQSDMRQRTWCCHLICLHFHLQRQFSLAVKLARNTPAP